MPAAASPLAEIVKTEREPGDAAQSDDEILDWVRNRATTIYHPAGTCKMGQDTAMELQGTIWRCCSQISRSPVRISDQNFSIWT